MQPSSSRISELSSIIAKETAIVDGFFSSTNLPALSFEQDGPVKVPIPAHETDVLAAQEKVIASTQELHDLMKGPTEMLMGISIINPNDTLSLQAMYHYDVASHVPLHGTTSVSELSHACGLNEIDLRRLLRHAMTNHIFQDRDGGVAHTAASRILKEDKMTRDIVGIMCEEMVPGAVRTVDALDRWGEAKAPNESGFSLGHNTDLGLYEVLGHHPKRGTRFVNAMSGFANRSGIDTLANAFDWTSVRTVVDVGGGRGEVSIALAERFEHLHFTVQDLEHVVKENALKEAGELDERVKFVHHDYFAPQSVSGADVYYFRYIFHNLPDASCVKLLKAQIPALKPGAHVIIQDAVVPEPRVDLSPYKEKYRRSMDLVMLTFFGARERTLKEWKDVVERADHRFEVGYNNTADGHQSDILDVVWNGGKRKAEVKDVPARMNGESKRPRRVPKMRE